MTVIDHLSVAKKVREYIVCNIGGTVQDEFYIKELVEDIEHDGYNLVISSFIANCIGFPDSIDTGASWFVNSLHEWVSEEDCKEVANFLRDFYPYLDETYYS